MAQKSVRIEVPKSGYRRLMAFNRFYIESVDGFLIMHFALLNTSGVLHDRYACTISKAELSFQKESFMNYLGKVGTLGDPPPAWQPTPSIAPIDFCNYFGLIGNSDFAEINLCNVSARTASEAKPNAQISADAIALLRCSLEVQTHWLKGIIS